MAGGRNALETAGPILSAGIRTFTFHDDAAPVLHGVELAFVPGTFTAVLGPSGSGKSTLGRVLAGKMPEQGS